MVLFFIYSMSIGPKQYNMIRLISVYDQLVHLEKALVRVILGNKGKLQLLFPNITLNSPAFI